MGVSYSFGCSWSTYTNGCKFRFSKKTRKFNLGKHDTGEEGGKSIGKLTNKLAEQLVPRFQKVAPGAYQNQAAGEAASPDCCLGEDKKDGAGAKAKEAGVKLGRPFTSVTICMDFSAHRHKDSSNMYGGCTVVA